MGPSAHVTETEVLVAFRAALCTFGDQAKDALGTIDHEIRRAFAFLDDKAREWQVAERHAEDKVIQAKIELTQRRNQRIGDRKPDTSFQEKVLRQALDRLELVQRKLAATRRWQRDLPHNLMDYEGPSRQLQNALDGDVPRMIAFLDMKIAALEAYTQ